MTTTAPHTSDTTPDDGWCTRCAGTGVIDAVLSWSATGVACEPKPCRDCDGAGWFNAAGEPADPPRSRTRLTARNCIAGAGGVLAVFTIIAITPWLVEHCWPAAAAIAAGLIGLAVKLHRS